jgi:3-oxoacyl-[acyl-carrier protein] reductase
MFDLTGIVAVVTGAGQGMGAGIAQALATQGAIVAVNDLYAERAQATVDAITEAGGQAIACAFDVTDFENVETAITAVADTFGPVGILVNNAGVPVGMGLQKFRESVPADWRKYIEVNVYGVMNCSLAVINGMCDQGFGRVITIASGAGTHGLGIGVSGYGASKGGGIAFMRHLALEHAKYGVTANSIALGLMGGGSGEPEATAGIARSIPTKRLGSPDDVGALCAYLASREASWMTGQTLHLNGGGQTS